MSLTDFLRPDETHQTPMGHSPRTVRKGWQGVVSDRSLWTVGTVLLAGMAFPSTYLVFGGVAMEYEVGVRKPLRLRKVAERAESS